MKERTFFWLKIQCRTDLIVFYYMLNCHLHFAFGLIFVVLTFDAAIKIVVYTFGIFSTEK